MGSKNRMLSQRRISFVCAFGAVCGLPALAHAEQFVVAHADYTHSAQTTTDSHYRVRPTPETPANWASPVDYAHGSVHVRLDVQTKPSATPTRYQICFEMKMNYCCTDQAPVYTTTGVVEWDTKVENLWRPGPVDFGQGIVQSALILKDTNNVKPAPENVGEITSALYMPSDVDVTVTVVSSGSTYAPPAPPDTSGGGSSGAGGVASAGSGGAQSSPTLADRGGSESESSGADAGGGSGATVTEPAAAAGAIAAGSSPLTTAASGTAPTQADSPTTVGSNETISCTSSIARGGANRGVMWLFAALAAVFSVRYRRRLR
jgi:hypothetical protein